MNPVWIAVLVVGCAIEAVFIILEQKKKMTAAVALKALASLLFVLLGVLCAISTNDRAYAAVILIGLACGAVGDGCLNLRHQVGSRGKAVFMAGIAAFLIGHLFYLFALISRAPKMLLWAVPACAVVSVLMLRFILKRIEAQGAIRIFGIVSRRRVSNDVLRAGLLPLQPSNPGYLLFAAGAVLFAASDVLLVLNQFGKRQYPAFRPMNLSLYYLGQICIALTIAFLPAL